MRGSWAVNTSLIILVIAAALALRLGWEVAAQDYQAKTVMVEQDERTKAAAFALPRIGGGGRGSRIFSGGVGGGGGGAGDIDTPNIDLPDTNIPDIDISNNRDGNDSNQNDRT